MTARSDKPKGPQAIAEEARKGYDFLVVGIAKTRSPDGGFSKDISLITKGFEGPLAVVDAHEPRRDRLPRRYGKILIPVNGTEVSRRAAEIGLTLARASDAQVTALFVTRAGGGGKANSAARKRATRRNERAILKDIGALGDRYDVDVRSYDAHEFGARQTRSSAKPSAVTISSCSASAGGPARRCFSATPPHRCSNGRIRQIYLWRVEMMRQNSYCGEQS